MAPINHKLRGIRDSLPAGTILGRVSGGNGPPEVLRLSDLRGLGLATAGQAGAAHDAANNFGFSYDRPINSITPSAPIRDVVAGVAWTLLAAPGFGSHQAWIDGVGPSGTTTFTIKVAGVTVGTFSFAAGATSATFSISADAPVGASDTVTLVAPASLNGMTGTIYGTVLGQRK